ETVKTEDLSTHITGLLRKLTRDLPQDLLLLHRIHRTAKPNFLPPNTPRDILLRMHYH
ncbi:Hypothetical predicted protein, partial [Pelobates cultripes]